MAPKKLFPSQAEQEFGDNPTAVRESEHYQLEYIHEFVEKWDELIDWDARGRGEGDFFIRELKKRGKKKVLDVAAGTGYHSVKLLEAGFDVTSVDGSPVMLAKAFENARKRDKILKTVHADWRWLNRDVSGRYDAVICLGNSFTHLFDENDRRKSLAEFYSALRHDGILIIDHRNYDAILDHGFSSKHTYYYAGENVKAAPEHIDEGLARFRYEFPDQSVFHLNMFPLRKKYVRNLLREVGFQTITTYGDFHETYKQYEPDFMIHIAEKSYVPSKPEVSKREKDLVQITKDYYNSREADEFYYRVWGGEDIHIGIYQDPGQSIKEASRQTVWEMAKSLPEITKNMDVLDIGAGYGGAARLLAGEFGCRVHCLNLSEKENERNESKNKTAGLADQISVTTGNFEDIPFGNDAFDLVWSQDALLHSNQKDQVFREAARVLKPGGRFIFTDPMQSDNCPAGVLQPVLDRIHLEEMGSVQLYKDLAVHFNLEVVEIRQMPEQLILHYSRVLDTLQKQYAEVVEKSSAAYLKKMMTGLQHWIDAGEKGYLNWGILQFKKPEK